MTDNNLAPQSYWDDSYSSYEFKRAPQNDVIRNWIEKYIPKTSNSKCIEIGCFPGRFLSVFGELGYELHGIDMTPRVRSDLPNWFLKEGFKTGSFYQANFFDFKFPVKYDLVCSFGFIEHFNNWEDVIQKHIDLVDENGYLVISTPNFRGLVQRFIHRYLDLENYKRHNVNSMNPDLWKKILEKRGFKIVHYGYFSFFDCWIDKRPSGFFKTMVWDGIKKIEPLLRKLPSNVSAYSPYCGIIAQKI